MMIYCIGLSLNSSHFLLFRSMYCNFFKKYRCQVCSNCFIIVYSHIHRFLLIFSEYILVSEVCFETWETFWKIGKLGFISCRFQKLNLKNIIVFNRFSFKRCDPIMKQRSFIKKVSMHWYYFVLTYTALFFV